MATTIQSTSKPATIIKHLQESMGIKAPEGATQEELLQLVIDNGGKVETKGDSTAENAAPESSDIDALCKTEVRIKVYEKKDADAQLTVGVNGDQSTIVRGVEVTVPYPVYDLLKNSITTEYEQRGDEMVEKKVETDPFGVIAFNVKPGQFPD